MALFHKTLNSYQEESLSAEVTIWHRPWQSIDMSVKMIISNFLLVNCWLLTKHGIIYQERAHVLTGLRTGQIPEALSKRCPVQAKYIQHLTRKNSAQRPSAIQLLQSELFQNSGNVCTTYLILGKTGSPTWSLLFCFFSHGKNKFIERTERAPQGTGGPSQERHWPDVV